MDPGRGDVPRENQVSRQRDQFLHVLACWLHMDQVRNTLIIGINRKRNELPSAMTIILIGLCMSNYAAVKPRFSENAFSLKNWF